MIAAIPEPGGVLIPGPGTSLKWTWICVQLAGFKKSEWDWDSGGPNILEIYIREKLNVRKSMICWRYLILRLGPIIDIHQFKSPTGHCSYESGLQPSQLTV